eukprot:2558272-Lingulodinium_polyedra.AAC.1
MGGAPARPRVWARSGHGGRQCTSRRNNTAPAAYQRPPRGTRNGRPCGVGLRRRLGGPGNAPP